MVIYRRSKNDWTKGRGFNESIKTKTKQNKTNVRPEKDVTTPANQTPGGYKFAPLVASQKRRASQHEPACFALSSLWSFPSRSSITTACRSPALAFPAAIDFAIKCPAPRSAVLRHSPSSRAAAIHWSALMPKALRPSRKHPTRSFSWSPTQPAPPTNVLRTSRTSAVSYPPCAPQILRTRSASCLKSPRCSHFPS